MREPARGSLVLQRHVLSTEAFLRLAVVAVALVALSWLVDLALLEAGPPAVDGALTEAVVRMRTGAVLLAARVLTLLGDLWVVALIGGLLVVAAYRRAGRWDSAWLVAATVGGTLAVTAVAKVSTARPRPDEALVGAISHAFPSGHASRAAAVCALLAWLALRWGRRPSTRVVGVVAAVALALGIGASRVVLGAHWPTDVLAGWGLGLAWFVTCLAVTRPQQYAPVETAASTTPAGDL